MQECQYKQLTTIDQLAIHFSLEGNMIHIDSDEAKRQLAQAPSTGEGLLASFRCNDKSVFSFLRQLTA